MKTPFLFVLFIFFWCNIYAEVLTIPSEKYPAIQAGIDSAMVGDTVLVQPGIYYENIFIKKNVTVASLFLTTNDTSYISNTVIDGNKNDGCIFIQADEAYLDSTTVLCGFTITNGLNERTVGLSSGGITCLTASPILSDLIIKGNRGRIGGGILVSELSVPVLSNITIKENYAERGGGLAIWTELGGNSVKFDTVHLCNIYNNYASLEGNDIWIEHPSGISLVLDTFTVINPTDFHIYKTDFFNISIKNRKNPTVINVPTDLYPTIQAGIDSALAGDTVLVQPGIYYENIVINKNITVASLFLTANDKSYITNTIIDGNKKDGCVFIQADETYLDSTTVLCGFSITNGLNERTYGFSGGGITCFNASPILSDLIIKGNRGQIGGGILVSEPSYPTLKNVTVMENYAGQGGGLGIFLQSGHTNIKFDTVHLCNIYNNFASFEGSDIFYEVHDIIDLVLDTFTVIKPTDFHISRSNYFSLNIKNGWLEQSKKDLFVSPNGDDKNSGISENEPLESLYHALLKIDADSINPLTIHFANGNYNLEPMPEKLPDYLTLEGESMDGAAIHIMDNLFSSSRTIRLGKEGRLQNLTLIGGGNIELEMASNTLIKKVIINGIRISIHDIDNAIIEDAKICNINNSEYIESSAITIYNRSNCTLKNLEISNNSNQGLRINNADATVVNCTISRNKGSDFTTLAIGGESNVDIVNSIFWNRSKKEIHYTLYDNNRNVNLRVLNSIIKGGTEGIYKIKDGTVDYFLEGNFDIYPMFTDSINGDFTLQASSPAIDAGIQDTLIIFNNNQDTIVIPPMEYYGSGIDIGAYEYHPTTLSPELNQPEKHNLITKIYPNPFKEITNIEFSVPSNEWVTLKIFNSSGNEIATLLSEKLSAGKYTYKWNSDFNPPGVFICQLRVGNIHSTRLLVISK